MPKVSIIGAGQVGGLCAARIAETGLAKVLLLDIDRELCQGKVLDIQDSLAFLGLGQQIKVAKDCKDLKDSDIIVITAGFARRPGMTRDDLLQKNSSVIKEIVANIKRHSPGAIIIMVTNPVDVLTYFALKLGKFDPKKIFGMGSSLDDARLKSIIVGRKNVASNDIDSQVLGQHGDLMLILSRQAKIGQESLEKALGKAKSRQIIKLTTERGKQIVSLLKSGSAYFAPSAAVTQIVKAILLNEDRIISVSVYVKNLFAIKEVCLGLPARLGEGGIKEIVLPDLNKQEIEKIRLCAENIKSNIAQIRKLS